MLGGSMRQAGVVASAGTYALHHMVNRLEEDHENARRLANGIRSIPGISLDREDIQTNIFFADIVAADVDPQQFVDYLRSRGVLINAPRGTSRRIRFVTHYGITASDIDVALNHIDNALKVANSRTVSAS